MTVDQLIKRLSTLSKQGHGRLQVRVRDWDGDYTTFGLLTAPKVKHALSETERGTLCESPDDRINLPFVVARS